MSEQGEQCADRLWADYARTRDPRIREAIIRQFQRLAYSIANRFTRRGAETEDLVQVAMLGLVKAVDRFDPATRYRFTTFAAPTILGEIRRYFRDQSWSVYVPRGMKDRSQQVERSRRVLTERLGRGPTLGEIARDLELPEETVTEALALLDIARPISLDAEIETADAESPGLMEQCLGREDSHLRAVEHRVSVRQALDTLDAPLREVMRLRYVSGLTQREVAGRLGLTQMRVSRLEKRAVELLRQEFTVH